MKKLKYTLVIILLLVLTSCESSLESTAPNYFPLKLGNEWNFNFYSHNGDYYSSFSFKIVKRKTVNGKEYFGFDKLPPGFPTKYYVPGLDSIYVRQNDKGDIMLLADNTEYPYLVFSGVFNKNVSNTVCTNIMNSKFCYTVESNTASIITSLGILHPCFKIGIDFTHIMDDEITIGFAPGYGPVETYYHESGAIGRIANIKIN